MSSVLIKFECDFDDDYPSWLSFKLFDDRNEWEIYHKFIKEIRYISITIGDAPCFNTYDIELKGCFEICDHEFSSISDGWHNFRDIFEKIDDKISDRIGKDLNFSLIASLDSDIRKFYPLYIKCCEYTNYLDVDHNYSNTYLDLLPEPIYGIMCDMEYYHQIYNGITAFIDTFESDLGNYFRDEYSEFEIIKLNKSFAKIMEEYRVKRTKIKEMICRLKNEID